MRWVRSLSLSSVRQRIPGRWPLRWFPLLRSGFSGWILVALGLFWALTLLLTLSAPCGLADSGTGCGPVPDWWGTVTPSPEWWARCGACAVEWSNPLHVSPVSGGVTPVPIPTYYVWVPPLTTPVGTPTAGGTGTPTATVAATPAPTPTPTAAPSGVRRLEVEVKKSCQYGASEVVYRRVLLYEGGGWWRLTINDDVVSTRDANDVCTFDAKVMPVAEDWSADYENLVVLEWDISNFVALYGGTGPGDGGSVQFGLYAGGAPNPVDDRGTCDFGFANFWGYESISSDCLVGVDSDFPIRYGNTRSTLYTAFRFRVQRSAWGPGVSAGMYVSARFRVASGGFEGVEPTPTPTPEGGSGGGLVWFDNSVCQSPDARWAFSVPEVTFGDSYCVTTPAVDWDTFAGTISVPGFEVCFQAISLGVVDVFGYSFDVDWFLGVLAGVVLLGWFLRS